MGLRGASAYFVQSLVPGFLLMTVFLQYGTGNILRPSSLFPDDSVSTPSGPLEDVPHQGERVPTTDAAQQCTAKGGQERFNVRDRLNDERGERGRPHEAAAILITRPVNNDILPVGDVVVAFQTHGFAPSSETPIEVLVPQNGDTPALLDTGNVITLLVDTPCTQLVSLSATVRGQRVSASVLFSTIPDKAAMLSARASLPEDAVWGAPWSATPSRLRGREDNLKKSTTNNSRTDGEGHAKWKARDAEHIWRSTEQKRTAGEQQWDNGVALEAVSLPPPLSLVFVGSLSLDGQKHIWLQQMEGLSRLRFAPKFLTFHESGGGEAESVDPEAAAWKTTTTKVFEERLHRAGVPLVKVSPPQLEVGSSIFGSLQGDPLSGEAPGTPLKEVIFRLVLEAIDRAGGEPRLMTPSWTREIFEYIADAVKSVSPDVLVVGNGKTLGDVLLTRAGRWAMRERGRIVMDFPNMDPAQGIVVDVVATPSHFVARHPDIEALVTASGAHVVVIPPGVDVASSLLQAGDVAEREADKAPAAKSFYHPACSGALGELSGACSPARNVVGYMGRLAPEKGPGLFLAVAARIAELIPSARFVVVGDGPLRPALEAMANRLGLARRVHFAGWADGVDLQRLLTEMDILFNPSLAPETFCVANIEAMAAGTPVAAFGVGGMLEYLLPGDNALVLDNPEPRAAATEITKALLDPRGLKTMAENGRRDVSTYFRVDTAVDRWSELYEALGAGWGSAK